VEDTQKDNHWHYNNKLKPFAQNLRNDGTKAEACIWKYVLRAGMMKGYKFRRQRPVLNYIADFMCKELKLIVEIDGITHDDELVQAKDLEKQKALEKAGFTVLRFTDNEVLNHIDGVRMELENWIDHSSPLPPP
jgi:very-short-patch-repair endonuclease